MVVFARSVRGGEKARMWVEGTYADPTAAEALHPREKCLAVACSVRRSLAHRLWRIIRPGTRGAVSREARSYRIGQFRHAREQPLVQVSQGASQGSGHLRYFPCAPTLRTGGQEIVRVAAAEARGTVDTLLGLYHAFPPMAHRVDPATSWGC